MPAGSTEVPHYKQSKPGTCLPACARVVLAALGDERTEEEAVCFPSFLCEQTFCPGPILGDFTRWFWSPLGPKR